MNGLYQASAMVDPTIIKLGTVADPGPELLLDKARLAKIKVRKLDMVIKGLEEQIDVLRLEQEMLKKEYKIK